MPRASKITRRAGLLGTLLGLTSAASAAPAVPALRGGHPLHISSGPPLTVRDGSTTVYPTSVITLDGATVTDGGAGEALIAVSGGGGSSGLVLLPGYPLAIPNPSLFWDVTIPSGYMALPLIVLDGWDFSTADWLGAAFSFDGGTTFLNAIDSYLLGWPSSNGTPGSVPTDFMLDVGNAVGGTNGPFSARMDNVPGSDTAWANLSGTITRNHNTGTTSSCFFCMTPNPSSVVPFTPSRLTTIRFLPYGNGDCNPPTSGNTIIAGSLSVYGVPAP